MIAQTVVHSVDGAVVSVEPVTLAGAVVTRVLGGPEVEVGDVVYVTERPAPRVVGVAAGAAPDVAMRGAFLGFKRFVTEMVHGTTDRAKAAHKIITIETYNAARSRAATQSALASLGRDLKLNPERYKESFND